MPLMQDDAELVLNSPQLVGLHDARLHELHPNTMQRQDDLLGLGLHGYKAHTWLLACGPNGLRVGRVRLVALNKGANFARGDELHLMPESLKRASPFVRSATSLHHDQCTGTIGEPLQQAAAFELLTFNTARFLINPVQLERKRPVLPSCPPFQSSRRCPFHF